jgi:hypothetical protein
LAQEGLTQQAREAPTQPTVPPYFRALAMTPLTAEQRAEFDALGRTNVLALLQAPALQEDTRRGINLWLAENDRQRGRRDMWTMIAAIVAAIAAIVAAIAAIIK